LNGIELLKGVFPEYREALCLLYEKAGSLNALLGLDSSALISLGAPPELAARLPLLNELLREMLIEEADKTATVSDSESAAGGLAAYFRGRKTELLAVAFLNGRGETITVKQYENGSSSGVAFDPSDITRTASALRARAVVLAHNHPDGFAVPSRQDIEMTRDLTLLLGDMGIAVADHIIFAGNEHTALSTRNDCCFLAFAR